MTDYSLSAVFDIRNAMWQELTDAGIFDINDYYPDGFAEAIIPIIPAQKIPGWWLPTQKHKSSFEILTTTNNSNDIVIIVVMAATTCIINNSWILFY